MDKQIVSTIIKKCLGYKSGEDFLIVADDKKCNLAYDLYKVAQSLGINVTYLQIKPRQMHGEEPPSILAEAFKKADAAILLTSMSLSHTKARKIACTEFGTRIASLPGVNHGMLNRAILIDYSVLKKKVAKLTQAFTQAKKIEIYTKNGTELTMSVKGRKGFADNGLYVKKGAFGNLPAGEASLAPCEGTTNGRLVIDASAPFIGKLKESIEIIIKDGYAQNIPLLQIRPLVKSFGRSVLNVAELGIGLNPKAKVTGIILEDEKALNTAHIAFGNNQSFGGKIYCPCHLDFVFFRPKIFLDGKPFKV